MKFAELLTYAKMKDMVSLHNVISDHVQYESEEKHSIVSIRLCKDSFQHANVMYRMEGTKIALIYADIFFTGSFGAPSSVFIKNASLRDLKNLLLGYSHEVC